MLIFVDATASEAERISSVQIPYLGLAGFLILLAVVVKMLHLPDARKIAEEETEHNHDGKTSVWQYKHMVLGAAAIFCYVGAEVAIGSLMIPWHRRLGYPPAFSAATLAAAATIDILIPPSIPMILFALSANASIAALFVAGIVPGLLMCAGFMGVCWWVGRSRGFPRDTTPFAWPAFRRHLLYASPALLLPVLIIVFLRFGIATPTEVAVLSTLYAGLVSAAIYRDLGWRRLNDAVVHAGLATGVVLLVIMASSAIGWLLTFDRMPDGVVHWVQSHVHSAWLVIVLMNLLMLFIGMFIDLPAAVLLLTPVFVPLAQSIGMDMTQLGIMMVVNLALGLYTPPVGTTLFITSSLARVKVGQTVRELIPFYLVALAVLALVSYVPASILR